MKTNIKDRKWIIVRIDGKIASISTDYRQLAAISSQLATGATQETTAGAGKERKKKKSASNSRLYENISATTVGFDEIWRLRQELQWEDLLLFGSDFQKKVWRKLWELTHPKQNELQEQHGQNGLQEPQEYHISPKDTGSQTSLISYSDFAELCQNRAGVRAVAHAIGLNPVSVVIPCHLVIPKESIDRIREIHKKAEATIFKGDDLCLNSILNDSSIDFGEYSMGKGLKRALISHELSYLGLTEN